MSVSISDMPTGAAPDSALTFMSISMMYWRVSMPPMERVWPVPLIDIFMSNWGAGSPDFLLLAIASCMRAAIFSMASRISAKVMEA